jgi:hypothetical protein
MRKKKIIAEAFTVRNFINFFLKSKADGTEEQNYKKLQKIEPEVAKLWKKWDTSIENLIQTNQNIEKITGKVNPYLQKLILKRKSNP